jgi:hypothetical protein
MENMFYSVRKDGTRAISSRPSCPTIKMRGRILAMFKWFRLLRNKHATKAFKRGYDCGLTVGLNLGKQLASNQPIKVGPESKIQREIEEIIRSKKF